MSIISWIVLGLIVGAIAKAIIPGEENMGILKTMILGIVGSLAGGFISAAIFNAPVTRAFFDLRTWLISIIGAVIVLALYGFITGKNKN